MIYDHWTFRLVNGGEPKLEDFGGATGPCDLVALVGGDLSIRGRHYTRHTPGSSMAGRYKTTRSCIKDTAPHLRLLSNPSICPPEPQRLPCRQQESLPSR